MTTTQQMPHLRTSGGSLCPRCRAALPAAALFCPICGERMGSAPSSEELAILEQPEVSSRYTSPTLLCRRDYVSLSLAADVRRQRPVAIRDIDVSMLNEPEQARAYAVVKREYDRFRRLSAPIPLLLPAIETHFSQGHLLTIMGNPAFPSQVCTLDEALRSGSALPKESIALNWVQHLCETLEELHRSKVVVAGIDPRVILLKNRDYREMPMVLISWLPEALSGMLPPVSPNTHHTAFMAPEERAGRPDVRSDIYSLGALLYLLLTGQPPPSTGVRPPSDVNSEINGEIDAVVMRAMSRDPAGRYQSVWEMQGVLMPLGAKSRVSLYGNHTSRSIPVNRELREEQLARPLADAADERDTQTSAGDIAEQHTVTFGTPVSTVVVESRVDDIPTTEFPSSPANTPLPESEQSSVSDPREPMEEDDVKTEIVPSTPAPADPVQVEEESQVTMPAPVIVDSSLLPEETVSEQTLPAPVLVVEAARQPELAYREPAAIVPPPVQAEIPGTRAIVPFRVVSRGAVLRNAGDLLRRVRDMLLGEQRLETTAAAIIETPLRVQPDQSYAIRIQLSGRGFEGGGVKQELSGGLSELTEGDTVFIEVRSAIYERYAYVVQQAVVTIPAAGYAAEITIPMRSLSQGPSGRRDRLHIFFLDDQRRPLYEKPFVVELFISHRVLPGREGHNVLTLPY